MLREVWQKLQKGDYPPAHRLSVNVLLSNSTFFCNFCSFRRYLVYKPQFFLHLYLQFYYVSVAVVRSPTATTYQVWY